MDLGQQIANELIAEHTPIIALYPGKFKPPHKGHFEVVKKAAAIADEVHIIISNNITEGYTPELSLKIWKQYKKLLPENVIVSISKNPSPITEVYNIVKDKSNNYFVFYGKEELGRFNSVNENKEKYSNVSIVNAGNVEGLSATSLREAITKKNRLAIKSLIPEGIKIKSFLLNFQLHEIKVNKPLTFIELKDKMLRMFDKMLRPFPFHNFTPNEGMVKFEKETKNSQNWEELKDVIKRMHVDFTSQDEEDFIKHLMSPKDLIEIKVNKPTSLIVGHKYMLDTSRGTGHISKRRGEYLGKFDDKHHFYQPGLGKLEIPNSEIGKRLIKDITSKEDLKENKEYIPGGLAKGKSLIDIAKHHRVPQADIFNQLQKGIKVEMEHTTSKEIAKEIAMDHLFEDPKYYDKLATIEVDEIKVNNPFTKYEDVSYYFHNTPSGFLKKTLEHFGFDRSLYSKLGEWFETLSELKRKELINILKLHQQQFEVDEIKVNKPSIKFPINVDTYEKAQKVGEILVKDGYRWYFRDKIEPSIFPFYQSKENLDNGKFREFVINLEDKEKKIVDWELVKLTNMRENKLLNEIFESHHQPILDAAIKYVCDKLKVEIPKIELIDNPEYTKEHLSFGGYVPSEKKIYAVIYNRNLADIMRSISHELCHYKQDLDNRLTPEAGKDGDEFENEANAFSGKMMREIGKQMPEIFEV